MAQSHNEIKDIILTSEDEREARIRMYQWGLDHGYAINCDPERERFLSNVLEQPLDEIYKNPAILWGRSKAKDDFQQRVDYNEGKHGKRNFLDGDDTNPENANRLLTFEQWMQRFNMHKDPKFYDICAYVASVFGSDVFNVFLQNAKEGDLPKFTIVENPGYISQHTDKFVEENEYRISDGEKLIVELIEELVAKHGIKDFKFPFKELKSELLTPIEFDYVQVCGWLCIDRNTKKCYIIKIS